MKILKTVRGLRRHLDQLKEDGASIGFVPTMGALHQGHISLVKRMIEDNDVSVCSVFVNPTQFNEKKDLARYPRTLKKDARLLREAGLDFLFAPKVSEVYPKNVDTSLKLELSDLYNVMEGKFRPGHFDGMAQVVNRLLDITTPDRLYMGQKDFQQFTIVRSMMKQLRLKTKLVVCPIIREEDGLAMSSRNARLTPSYRKKATCLHKTLLSAKERCKATSIKTVAKSSLKIIEMCGLKPEYFDIVDGKSLQSVKKITDSSLIVACTAAWAGNVRLIDNMVLKGRL